MTRTEERVTDALAARAGAVREDRLRPLRVYPVGRALRLRWLAPIAAAASIAIVAGVLAGLHSVAPQVPTAPKGLGYYVWYGRGSQLDVVSNASGRVAGLVPDPRGARGYQWLGAESGLRSYVAATADGSLYRFRLTAGGGIAGLTELRGVSLPSSASSGGADYELSPDGSRIAYLSATPGGHEQKLIVLNLRTGASTTWRASMHRAGRTLALGPLSWTGNSATLAFAETWCKGGGEGSCGRIAIGELNPAGPGGSLDARSTIVRREQAQSSLLLAISPSGTAILQIVYPAGSPGVIPNQQELTSLDLASGRRSTLREWNSNAVITLYNFGGLEAVLSQVPGQGETVVGWVGQSGALERHPVR